MQIRLNPMRRDDRLCLQLAGDVLTVNGEEYDFGPLPEGATLPRAAVDCPWLVSDVTRQDGRICLTLILPHGVNAPPETLFPQPVLVVADGPVELPPHDVRPPLPEEIAHAED